MRLAICVAITVLYLRPAAAVQELIADGGFESASVFAASSAGVSTFSAWRYFAVNGAQGQGSIVADAHSGAHAFRLSRQNTAGDCAIDKDLDYLRIPLEPGKTYCAGFWAKSSSNTILEMRLPALTTPGIYIGAEHISTYTLTSDYRYYFYSFQAEINAQYCGIAFRSLGAGEFTIDDISMSEIPTSAPLAPVIALPWGISTSRQPRIEWRGECHEAWQARIFQDSSIRGGVKVIWDSGVIESPSFFSKVSGALSTGTTFRAQVRLRNSLGWSEWSPSAVFRIEPTPPWPEKIYTFNLNYTRNLDAASAFEHAHFASALQGIVNRDKPRLYLDFVNYYYSAAVDMDADWLTRLSANEGWLNPAPIQNIPTIEFLAANFRTDYDGVVLWDPAVSATSNVASTLAGAEKLLPIRYDTSSTSLYSKLVLGGPKLPVRVNLVGKFTGTGNIPDTSRASTGSAKCDAYLWALDRCLISGECDSRYMGFYIDAYWIKNPGAGGNVQNHTLTNHDYFVARRGFFWDLSVWGDEQPVDDPKQPLGADLTTLKTIMLAAYQKLGGREWTHVGGFTPWAFKYTNFGSAGGRHDGVLTEWETARILTSYNAFLDADALGLSAMANASFVSHFPLAQRYTQPPPPTLAEMRSLGWINGQGNVAYGNYILHYVGDYDSAAWVWNTLPARWSSDRRGLVKMPWAINPNLCDRARPFFDYSMRERTGSDFLMAGDSGAGYVNPSQIVEPRAVSGLPPANDSWRAHCLPYYQQFNYSFTGFLINGSSGVIPAAAEQMYETFSANGVVNQYGLNHAPLHLEGDMPAFYLETDLSGVIANDTGAIHGRASQSGPKFMVFRSVLQDISYYFQLNAMLKYERPGLRYAFCSPLEFAYLARLYLGGSNDSRASYLYDTLPNQIEAGRTYSFEAAVRNDGWDAWSAETSSAHRLLAQISETGEMITPFEFPITEPISPGAASIFSLNITAPHKPGKYFLCYEMSKGAQGKFSTNGPAPVKRTIEIIPSQATPTGYLIK